LVANIAITIGAGQIDFLAGRLAFFGWKAVSIYPLAYSYISWECENLRGWGCGVYSQPYPQLLHLRILVFKKPCMQSAFWGEICCLCFEYIYNCIGCRLLQSSNNIM